MRELHSVLTLSSYRSSRLLSLEAYTNRDALHSLRVARTREEHEHILIQYR